MKDNIATLWDTTTAGSAFLQDHRSPFEATVVRQLQGERWNGPGDGKSAATLPVVIKTNLDEFGMGSHSMNSFFGPVSNSRTRNHKPHSAGGSSGGSAVAVAESLGTFALGTDTGGSVRLPAAYTGIVGFKPSYGIVSRWGVIPYANSLDTVGFLSKRVEQISPYIEDLWRRPDPRDPTSLPERSRHRCISKGEESTTLRIGVPIEYNIEELHPIIREAWTRALEAFQKQGHTIVPVSLPNTKHALSAYYVIAAAEAASNLSKYDGVRYGTQSTSKDGPGEVLYSKNRGEFFGAEVKRRILLGSYTLSSEAKDNYFLQAQKVRRLVQRDFDRVFLKKNPLREPEQYDISDLHESIEMDSKLGPQQVDFLLCPTASTLAPTHETVKNQSTVDTYINDIFTVPASLAGIPAISVPMSISEELTGGAPPFVGIQIIGQYGDDMELLKVAQMLDEHLNTKLPEETEQAGQGVSVMDMMIMDAALSPGTSRETPLPADGIPDASDEGDTGGRSDGWEDDKAEDGEGGEDAEEVWGEEFVDDVGEFLDF